MRKYFFFILLFIGTSSNLIAYANTTVGWNNNTIECPSEAGTSSRTLYGVPSSNTASAPTSGSQTCITHYYYTSGDHAVAFVYGNG
jgi:hypothetical protein